MNERNLLGICFKALIKNTISCLKMQLVKALSLVYYPDHVFTHSSESDLEISCRVNQIFDFTLFPSGSSLENGSSYAALKHLVRD